MIVRAVGTISIHLGDHAECVHAHECDALAGPLLQKMANGNYDYPVSVLELAEFDAYLGEHRTARKRPHERARDYRFDRIERADHVDTIFAINTSAPERQAEPMSNGYRERPAYEPLPFYPCPRHRIDTWGVFAGDTLVAYLVLYVSGELVLASSSPAPPRAGSPPPGPRRDLVRRMKIASRRLGQASLPCSVSSWQPHHSGNP